MSKWLSSCFLLIAIGYCLPVCFGQGMVTQQLDSLLLKCNREQLPGFAVRVLKNNVIIYEGQCGFANIHQQIPITSSSIVNIASISKQFTAYCIYLLEERGLLNTSEEVHTYLPELPDFGYPITLKHLLAHTSGLRDYPEFLSLLNKSTSHNLQYDEMISFLSKHRELNFLPGDQFCYSNTGYMLLAKIIEGVSKQSYADFLQHELFDPLHMSHTFVNEGVLNEQTDGTRDYTLNKCKTKASKSKPYRDVIGATGIFSSLEDLTKWDELFYKHEQGIDRSFVIAKMEKVFTLNDGSSCHYGGGLILKNYRGKPVVEHSGGWGEYLTQYRRFPTSKLTILVATNSFLDSPFDICDKISNILLNYTDSLTPSALLIEALSLKNMDGMYVSQDNIIRHVQTQSDSGTLRVYNTLKTNYHNYALQAIETLADQTTGYFFADSAKNQFVFHILPDSTKEFIWYAGSYFYKKRIYSFVEPIEKSVSEYKGTYYCKELDKQIKIRYKRRKNELSFSNFPLRKKHLKPMGNNLFQLEGETYLMRFTADGIVFGNDWIYNFYFEKRN